MASLIATALAASSSAAVVLTGDEQTYTQNFDSLADDGDGGFITSWTDDTTIAGWFVDGINPGFDAPGTTLAMATSPSGGLQHLGTATDRALGFRNANSSGDWLKGVQFQNTTGGVANYEEIAVSFTIEKWQDRGQDEVIQLQYKITVTGGNILNSGGWIDIDDLTIPDDPAGNGNTDGNLTVNQFELSGTLTNIKLAPGRFITFRYLDDNVSGNDNALAIDEVSIAFIPESSSLSPAPADAARAFTQRR
ncbi:MAG: hypothetical protein AAF823_01475 [Planctomycetota bacterium]